MNYVDKNIKTINQDKTIGVIICKKDNSYYIEYSSNSRIYHKELVFTISNNNSAKNNQENTDYQDI